MFNCFFYIIYSKILQECKYTREHIYFLDASCKMRGEK